MMRVRIHQMVATRSFGFNFVYLGFLAVKRFRPMVLSASP
jgi:hypothetical protein